jgi:zinc protease
VRKLLQEQFLILGQKGPSAEELAKAKNRIRSDFLFGLEGNEARASHLGTHELYWGDAGLLEKELDRLLAVSAEQVRKAVAQYLTPAHLNEVLVEPAKASAGALHANGHAGSKAAQ